MRSGTAQAGGATVGARCGPAFVRMTSGIYFSRPSRLAHSMEAFNEGGIAVTTHQFDGHGPGGGFEVKTKINFAGKRANAPVHAARFLARVRGQ